MTRNALFAFAFALVALFGTGCNTGWEGRICDQTYQINFAGMLSDGAGPQCLTHDYDDDGWSAGLDPEDRMKRYGDHQIDGSGSGPISECINNTPLNQLRPEEITESDFDWACVHEYWRLRLDKACAEFAIGELKHVVAFQREEDAMYEWCSEADIATYEGWAGQE